MSFLKRFNEHSTCGDLLFSDFKRFAPLNDFSDNVLTGPSEFTKSERELMAAYVSGLNSCSYCFGAHSAVAAQFGIKAELLEAMLYDLRSSKLDHRLKPVFLFIKKLTLTPSKVVESDAQAVFKVGWTEQALTDCVSVCALFNLYNRLLDGHGIKGNDNIFTRDGILIKKHGYKMPWFIKLWRKLPV